VSSASTGHSTLLAATIRLAAINESLGYPTEGAFIQTDGASLSVLCEPKPKLLALHAALASVERMFFFEKKNQKTFVSAMHCSEDSRQHQKVFCFFFSKKKCFPYFLPAPFYRRGTGAVPPAFSCLFQQPS
jgi:hypothetical protein